MHPDAYAAYQSCRDLRAVVQKAASVGAGGTFSDAGLDAGPSSSSSSSLAIGINIMTPVLPMLVR